MQRQKLQTTHKLPHYAKSTADELLGLFGYDALNEKDLSNLSAEPMTSPGTTKRLYGPCFSCTKNALLLVEDTLEKGARLGFCGQACLSKYKLKVLQEEAEACLRENVVTAVEQEPEVGRTKNGGMPGIDRSAQKKHRKKSQTPRPHPYHLLNKKYWQNSVGGLGGHGHSCGFTQPPVPVELKPHRQTVVDPKPKQPPPNPEAAISHVDEDMSPPLKAPKPSPTITPVPTFAPPQPVMLTSYPFPIPLPLPIPVPIPILVDIKKLIAKVKSSVDSLDELD